MHSVHASEIKNFVSLTQSSQYRLRVHTYALCGGFGIVESILTFRASGRIAIARAHGTMGVGTAARCKAQSHVRYRGG
jgi:hypothetical protein